MTNGNVPVATTRIGVMVQVSGSALLRGMRSLFGSNTAASATPSTRISTPRRVLLKYPGQVDGHGHEEEPGQRCGGPGNRDKHVISLGGLKGRHGSRLAPRQPGTARYARIGWIAVAAADPVTARRGLLRGGYSSYLDQWQRLSHRLRPVLTLE
jgi:hypothetical protein